MASTLKKEVFVLYKRILRLGTTWKAVDPNRTSEERKYIIEEAKFWFRKNSRLADLQTIQDHIKEGEARFEMGEYLFFISLESGESKLFLQLYITGIHIPDQSTYHQTLIQQGKGRSL